jgi:putative ABC transport system ATP-binding protein
MDLLTDLNERQGVTFMIVTHEQEVARRTRRIMQLRDGKMVEGGL